MNKGPTTNSETTEFFSQTSAAFHGSYSTDPDFHERRVLWAGMVARFAPGKKEALDLGCGPGVLTQELLKANLRVTAVDGSAEMVELCKKNVASLPAASSSEFFHDYLPAVEKLGGKSFDLLLCSSVLEYVADLSLSVARIAQLLAPGGIAILSMPNRESIYRKYESAKFALTGKPEYRAHVKHLLTQKELVQLAGQAGLTKLECHYFGNASGPIAKLSSPFPVAKRKNLFLCVFQKI